MKIAEQHPEYGYRRTTSQLHDQGLRINHKVIEKLHQLWYLCVIKSVKPPKPNPIKEVIKKAGSQVNLVSRMTEIDDLEVLYTDYTEILYQRGQAKAQLMPIVDHKSKLAVGQALGPSADTDLALKAWTKAKKTLQRLGQSLENVIVHHDQDGVYTSHRWLNEILIQSKARISYSEDGARENVHMESFLARFKGENRALFLDQENLESLKNVVDQRIRYYNLERKHSALKYKSPIKYLKDKGKLSL